MSEVLKLGAAPRALDLDLVDNGVRLEAPMAPGVFFTVTPWSDSNKRFRRALENRHLKRALAKKVVNGIAKEDDEAEELVSQYDELRDDGSFVADAVVKDIEGLLNGSGNPVQYTPERARAVLRPDEWRHLRSWVVNESLLLAMKVQKGVEEDAKNLPTGSGGKRAGAGRSARTKSSKPT
jgi:hypothetical protein